MILLYEPHTGERAVIFSEVVYPDYLYRLYIEQNKI